MTLEDQAAAALADTQVDHAARDANVERIKTDILQHQRAESTRLLRLILAQSPDPQPDNAPHGFVLIGRIRFEAKSRGKLTAHELIASTNCPTCHRLFTQKLHSQRRRERAHSDIGGMIERLEGCEHR